MPNNILEELKTKFEDFASELENIEPEKTDSQIFSTFTEEKYFKLSQS